MIISTQSQTELFIHGWVVRDGKRAGRFLVTCPMPFPPHGDGTAEIDSIDLMGANGYIGTFEEASPDAR